MSNPLKEFVDAWSSTVSGSNSSLDRRTSYGLASSSLTAGSALALWQASDIAKVIAAKPAEDACRQGWELSIPDNKDEAARITSTLQDLGYEMAVQEALTKSRALGGAIIYLHTADPDNAQPLKPNTKILKLHVFSVGEVVGTTEYVSSLDSPSYGLPAYYSIQQLAGLPTTGLERIHYSRIVRFSQPIVSRLELVRNLGFGSSVLGDVLEPLRNFEIAFSDAAGLVTDFAQGVMTLSGLNNALSSAATPEDQAALKLRLQSLNTGRSLFKALLLDAGDSSRPAESFTRVATPMSGLPELLDRTAQRLASATRIPVSILMGAESSGLTNSNSGNIEQYNTFIQSIQVHQLKPALEQLVKSVMTNEPPRWSISFKALSSPSESESANTRLVQAQVDNTYISTGVLTAQEVRLSRFGDAPSLLTSLQGK